MGKLNEILLAAINREVHPSMYAKYSGRPGQYLADTAEAALIAASGGPDHLIQVSADGWTIQHPLDERFEDEDLFVCKYSQAGVVIAENIHAAEGDGRFRLWEDRTAFQWERVTA